MENRYLKPSEVARMFKVTKETVYRMIKRGELPAIRFGKSIRIDSNRLSEMFNNGQKN